MVMERRREGEGGRMVFGIVVESRGRFSPDEFGNDDDGVY